VNKEEVKFHITFILENVILKDFRKELSIDVMIILKWTVDNDIRM
jgi:hypothetical protein